VLNNDVDYVGVSYFGKLDKEEFDEKAWEEIDKTLDWKSSLHENFAMLAFTARSNHIHILAYADARSGPNSPGKHMIFWMFMEAVEMTSWMIGK